MEAERQENLMLSAQDNRERGQHKDKDYLSVAAESCEKFNSGFVGKIDELSSEEIRTVHNIPFGRTSCEAIINDKTPFPEGVYRPVEPEAVKVKKR